MSDIYCGIGGVSRPPEDILRYWTPPSPDGSYGITSFRILGGIRVVWSFPATNAHSVAYFELYRSSSNDVNASSTIAQVSASYYDDMMEEGRFHYWVRWVSLDGVKGELIGPTVTTAVPPGQDIVEYLTDSLTSSHLGQSLRDEIARIEFNKLGIDQEMLARAEGDDTLAVAISTLSAELDGTWAAIQTESLARTTELEAFASTITTLGASFGESLALVQSELTTLADEYGASAELLQTVQAEMYGNEALGQIGLKAVVDELTEDVYSMFTAKVEANGLIGGFGVINDGQTVDAIFDVDRFAIGKQMPEGQTLNVFPFIVDGNDFFFNGRVQFANVIGGPPPDATRVVPQGAWENNKGYLHGDVVTFLGSSWIAKESHLSTPSNQPPNNAEGTSETWELLSGKGADGTASMSFNMIFQRSVEQPVAPDDSEDIPAFWYDDINEIPASTDPLWASVGTLDPESNIWSWQTPIKLEGEDGVSGMEVIVYRRTAVAPATPSGDWHFGFSSITGLSPGWSIALPAKTPDPVWASVGIAVKTGGSGSAPIQFTTPQLVFQDGEDGEDGTPGQPGQRGDDGESPLLLVATNSAMVVATDNSGFGGNWSSENTQSYMVVYRGNTEDPGWSFSRSNGPGVFSSIHPSSGLLNVTGMNGDTSYVDVTASKSGNPSLTFRVSVSKAKAGDTGASVTDRWLLPSVGVLVKDSSSQIRPSPLEVSAYQQEGEGTPSAYAGRFRFQVSSDGTSWTTRQTSSSNESSASFSAWYANTNYVRVILYAAGGTTTVLDEQIIPVAYDGLNGANGTNGTNGTNGADGASSMIVYRRATSEPSISSSSTGVPNNWTSGEPAGSLPLWESTGNKAAGSSWYYWSKPRVSATHWTKPNTTLIDGNTIFTGDAYVDTLQIKGNAVIIPVHGEAGETIGNNSMTNRLLVVPIRLAVDSEVIIWWSFEQAYYNVPPNTQVSWGFRLRANSFTVRQRTGMSAFNDYPSGVERVWLTGNNPDWSWDHHEIILDWRGSSSLIGAKPRLIIMGVQR